MFLMLNSLDERIKDIKEHPKYLLVLNNISRIGENYNPEDIKRDNINMSPEALDTIEFIR